MQYAFVLWFCFPTQLQLWRTGPEPSVAPHFILLSPGLTAYPQGARGAGTHGQRGSRCSVPRPLSILQEVFGFKEGLSSMQRGTCPLPHPLTGQAWRRGNGHAGPKPQAVWAQSSHGAMGSCSLQWLLQPKIAPGDLPVPGVPIYPIKTQTPVFYLAAPCGQLGALNLQGSNNQWGNQDQGRLQAFGLPSQPEPPLPQDRQRPAL